MKIFKTILFCALTVLSAKAQSTEESLLDKAKRIHEKVITIDTHDDIDLENFTAERNYTQRLNSQVNLPKMEEGGLDVAWLIVYTGQEELTEAGYDKAYSNAVAKFEAIHRLVEEYAPDRMGLATTSQEVRDILASGKKVAMIGVENGYPIGTDINRVEEFYNRGARYMSLAHNGHSQLCDSNTGEEDDVWLHDGLSELGKEVISEMNRLGMMIDISHPSKEAMRQMVELSKAPIIASHSSSRHLCNHSRNLDDEQLGWLKENGGLIQTVAFAGYVDTEKAKAFSKAEREIHKEVAKSIDFEMLGSWDEIQALDQDTRDAYWKKYQQVVELSQPQVEKLKETVPPVTVVDFVDHIDYLIEKMGIDGVGISSDFDGGGGIEDWQDASETFNVTLELVKRGYTEEEIAKLWGENLLRILDEVQAVAEL